MTQATCADSTGALVAHPLAGATGAGAATPFTPHAAQLRTVAALARDTGRQAVRQDRQACQKDIAARFDRLDRLAWATLGAVATSVLGVVLILRAGGV